MPSCCTGAKIAERAPTATRRVPSLSSCQASARSPSDNPLWSTATSSPNAPRNRLTVWGVSAISGTSTIAPAPASSTRRTASMYTRVLPLPVTPNSIAPRPGCSWPIALMATAWVGDGRGGGVDGRSRKGSRQARVVSMRAKSVATSARISAELKPSCCSRWRTGAAPPSASTASNNSRCRLRRPNRSSRSSRVGESPASTSTRSSRAPPRAPPHSAAGSSARTASPSGAA